MAQAFINRATAVTVITTAVTFIATVLTVTATVQNSKATTQILQNHCKSLKKN